MSGFDPFAYFLHLRGLSSGPTAREPAGAAPSPAAPANPSTQEAPMPADVRVPVVIRPVEELRERLLEHCLPTGHGLDSVLLRRLDLAVDKVMWAAAEGVAQLVQDALDARKAAA